jgi:hypothetical protein
VQKASRTALNWERSHGIQELSGRSDSS